MGKNKRLNKCGVDINANYDQDYICFEPDNGRDYCTKPCIGRNSIDPNTGDTSGTGSKNNVCPDDFFCGVVEDTFSGLDYFYAETNQAGTCFKNNRAPTSLPY